MRRWSRPKLAKRMIAFVCLLLLARALHAQDTVIQTSLLGRLESKRITVGSSIFVRTVADWKQGRCRLKEGDTLEARVTSVEHRTPSSKWEHMELRFLPLTCVGNEAQEIVPILVAIQSRPHTSDNSMLDRAYLMTAFSAAVGAEGGRAAATPGQQNAGARSMGYGVNSGQSLRVGDVRGFPGVTLTLPVQTLDPTGILSSHEMLFDPEAQFFLVVRTVASHTPPVNVAGPSSRLPETRPLSRSVLPQQPVEVETCVDSGCKLADVPALHTGGQLERQLSLRSLGYKPRKNRVLLALGEDSAVRFIGEDELLVTFNVHPLIERSAEERVWQSAPRIIRALLISARNGKVLHAEDWQVNQAGPYLWPLADGRVLAAVGGALTIFGPNLKIERQWTLPGSLALVRVSPSRNLIVAGIVNERHSPEEHHRLIEFMGPGHETVEENGSLTFLDGQLNVLGTKELHAHPDVPDVLDSGLLVSDPVSQSRWKVQELRWNGGPHTIAQVRSPCPLRISTLPTNLILLVGCSSDASNSWYRILRRDGKTLLKGSTASNGWLENADALSAKGVFAIGILEATRPIDFENGMYAREFQKLAISVYSSKTGQRLYATPSLRGTVDRQSFALSENGDRLAVLNGEDITMYRTGMTIQAKDSPSNGR